MRPPAPAQPARLAPAYFPQAQAAPPRGARRVPSESLLDEDRLLDFSESVASLIAQSELLDRVANFCELERGETEAQKRVMGMKRPFYHDPARATINLALPWPNVAEKIADLNFKIVNGHNGMKSCHPAKPLGSRDFFTSVGYHTQYLEGYVPSPESLVIPSKLPPTEQTAEDQQFCLVHKHPDDPRERVNISSGSFSIHASQLKEHEALVRKTAAAFSNALSIAEYVYNQPEISEEAKVGLHHLKLDLVAGANFAWRTAHNNMLMCRSVALDNLSRTIPPIDSDQVALLHAPFKGTTLFGGELAKLHRANKEHASSVTVYLAASPQTYSTKPYTGRGRSFRKGGSLYGIGRARHQCRFAPSATTTKPSKSGEGQATMTVTVPQDTC